MSLWDGICLACFKEQTTRNLMLRGFPSRVCLDTLRRGNMGVAQNGTGGVTQVLVHVSTYQGSILVPAFWSSAKWGSFFGVSFVRLFTTL